MTVRELIGLLDDFDPDLEVAIRDSNTEMALASVEVVRSVAHEHPHVFVGLIAGYEGENWGEASDA